MSVSCSYVTEYSIRYSIEYSQVGQNAISENPEEICYKLIFSLMRNIDQVVYHVKNPHSAEIRDNKNIIHKGFKLFAHKLCSEFCQKMAFVFLLT